MEQVINRWADVIAKESGIHRDIIAYGIKVFLNNIFGFAAIMITAAILGCLMHTFIAYVAVLPIKVFAGGRHTSNPVTCYLGSALVFVGIGLVSPKLTIVNDHITAAVICVALFGLIAISIYAPLDTTNKPIKPEQRKKLRKCAIVSWVICSIFLLTLSFESLFLINRSIITAALLGMLFTACGIIKKKKEVHN